ncbi:MAG: CBS domain-containing protein [Atribacterota bacterium]|jgi:CBS domain-containing protein|nr:CBS domain-containing protein [Atribacterota bacterium]MDD4896872.1 CBS domain-containing protein [Atribacterota bacterium]MDD5637072.1 CBS domain-containing protein [Atribacterota bacterium]
MTRIHSFNLQKLAERLKQIKAKDIMTEDVVIVKKDDTLADVAELMIDKRISGFPVLENDEIIGIITANDLFLVMDMIKTGEVLKNNSADYSQPKVSFAMSTEIITVSPEGNLDEIIALMKYRNIHTLPVTTQNKLVGVIGRRDVFKSFYCAIRDLIL